MECDFERGAREGSQMGLLVLAESMRNRRLVLERLKSA